MGLSEFYGPVSEAQAHRLIDQAIESGVRLFDTADVYGYGLNEILLGSHLRDHSLRADMVIATKGGIVRDRDAPANRGVDISPTYLRDAVHRSLDRLGTTIDLYYLHRLGNDLIHLEEALECLWGFVKDGAIGAVGLSEADALTIRRSDAALRRLSEGRCRLTAVQSEYSLMTRTVETNGVKDACDELGILLVAYSPISRGLLATPNFDLGMLSADDFRRTLPRFAAANLSHNCTLASQVHHIAQAHGATPAQVALSWLLSRGSNVIPIPGTHDPEHLCENLRALEIVLAPQEFEILDSTFHPGAAAGQRYAPSAMAAYRFNE